MQIRRRSPHVQDFVRFLILMFCLHDETAIRVDLLSPGMDTDLPRQGTLLLHEQIAPVTESTLAFRVAGESLKRPIKGLLNHVSRFALQTWWPAPNCWNIVPLAFSMRAMLINCPTEIAPVNPLTESDREAAYLQGGGDNSDFKKGSGTARPSRSRRPWLGGEERDGGRDRNHLCTE